METMKTLRAARAELNREVKQQARLIRQLIKERDTRHTDEYTPCPKCRRVTRKVERKPFVISED